MAYFFACAATEREAVEKSKASFDKELDRREELDSQWKFKPHQWPTEAPPGPGGIRMPSIKELHDRIRLDAERRKLPVQMRSYDEWLSAFPFALPPNCLPADADDAQLIELVDAWADMICDGAIDDAFRTVPDKQCFLPLSDFPSPQLMWTAEMLRAELAYSKIELPISRTSVMSPAVTHYDQRFEIHALGQRLICGLGAHVATIETAFGFGGSSLQVDAEIKVYETNNGLLATLHNVAFRDASQCG